MNLKKGIRKGIVFISGLVFTLFLNAQHVNEAKIENCENDPFREMKYET
jgi:hypothetical protein